ncbi:MAG: hypothetical protein CMG61_01095 [Candidatus Marinimicrobia bacterium]|nr:hypothetical protein [Candidatus Neomarinimicrobiota bacterium]|tara:strand:- start:35 stop:952 length:918 start_codon:yes stop_codon:yes gene_type:complete
MKYKLLILIGISSILSASEIKGYSIFNYDNNAFSIDRAYFQYTDDISDELFFKLRYDVGRDSDENGDTKLSTYLKNAYVDWKVDNIGKLSFGLLSTISYSIQEKTWGYRFISKSSIDKAGFITTADFGVGFSKKYGGFDLNIQLLNGEGYKKQDSDEKIKTYIRLMKGESNLSKNDGINYGIILTSYEGDDGDEDNENLFGIFSGWSKDRLRLGFEYYTFESWHINTDMLETELLTSINANYTINENFDIFMRHYMLETDGVNNSDTAETLIGGVWNPTKGLYIAPNVAVNDDLEDYRLTFMFKY